MKSIIVVGAGPSGCTAALTAASKGHHVRLIESRKRKDIVESGKTSFEALQNLTKGGDALQRLPDLKIRPEHVYRGAVVNGPSGKRVDIRMKEPHGYFLRRGGKGSLDHQLIEELEKEGIEIDFQTRVKNAEENGSLTLDTVKGKRKLKADIIIGADGLGSIVGRSFLPTLTGSDVAVGIGLQFKGPHGFEPGIAECWLGSDLCPGEYAYVLPTEDEISIVTTMRPHLMRDGQRPKDYLDRFLAIEQINERLQGAKVTGQIRGGVPVCPGTNLGKGSIMLVGEAGRLTDPVLGFGIMNAVISGKIASSCLDEDEPLDTYRSLMDSILMPDLRSRMKVRGSILDMIDDRELDKVIDVITTIRENVEPESFFNKNTRKRAYLKALPHLIRSGGVRTAARYIVPFLYANYSL